MYQNLKWIADCHATWEYHEKYVDKLPVNPPGSHLAEGDVMMNSVEIANWMSDDEWMFEPRLRDRVQHVSRIRMVVDEAPEEDVEYDCD